MKPSPVKWRIIQCTRKNDHQLLSFKHCLHVAVAVRKHQAWKNLTFLFLKETLLKENLQLAEEQIGTQSQQQLHQSSSHLR